MEYKEIMKEDAIVAKSKLEDFDKITEAITEKDILMELWSREEKNKLAPAGEWKNNIFVAYTFKDITFLYLILSILLVIPAFFYVPYVLYKFIERKKIKKQIIKERFYVKSIMPIPVGKEKFNELKKSYWGNRLIEEGLFYQSSISK